MRQLLKKTIKGVIPLAKRIKYIGNETREFPQFGVFKPDDETEYNEALLKTGMFEEIKSKSKEGDK